MSYSASFNNQAGNTPAVFDYASAGTSQVKTSPNKTLIQAATQGHEVNVKAAPAQITTVDATTGRGAVEQAQKCKASANTAQMDVNKNMASIQGTVKQMQQECRAMQKKMGTPTNLFVNTASARTDLASSITGGGSGLSELLNGLQEVRRLSTKEESKIKAQLLSELRVKSSNTTPTYSGPGQQQVSDITTAEMSNWAAIADNGFDLDTIMALDPNDPQQMAQHLPEVKDLLDIQDTINGALKLSGKILTEAESDISVDPQYYVENTRSTLASISKCKLPDTIPHIKDIKESIMPQPIPALPPPHQAQALTLMS